MCELSNIQARHVDALGAFVWYARVHACHLADFPSRDVSHCSLGEHLLVLAKYKIRQVVEDIVAEAVLNTKKPNAA